MRCVYDAYLVRYVISYDILRSLAVQFRCINRKTRTRGFRGHSRDPEIRAYVDLSIVGSLMHEESKRNEQTCDREFVKVLTFIHSPVVSSRPAAVQHTHNKG